MIFLDPNLALLDPWATIASEYTHHAPRPADFSLPRPYQAAGPGVQSEQEDAPEASPATEATEAADATAAASGKSRKRRKTSIYAPNEREQQAAARHAEHAPQLEAAAATVATWLRAAGTPTLQAALADAAMGQRHGQHERLQQERQEQQQQQQEADPDYRAMHEQRLSLKPKLQLLRPAASSPGGSGSGGRQQDVQQPAAAAGNLFDRLIASPGHGGSTAGEAEWLALAGGHAVVLPPGSRFLMSDARWLGPLVEDAAGAAGTAGATGAAGAARGYHCIVLDPPWENASARRSRRYPTLPSRHLLSLPLPALMRPGGCLVAMWITNRERHRRFIDEELLPAWGLRHLATWHWLKVTDGGEPVGRLDCEHRRPYESLLLCWPAHLPPPPPAPSDDSLSGGASGFHLLRGRPLVIAAVPPASHSRKPHLGALLRPLLPPQPRCLEMFARELHAGWTSWGNEVLKFQSTPRYLAPLAATGSASGGG